MTSTNQLILFRTNHENSKRLWKRGLWSNEPPIRKKRLLVWFLGDVQMIPIHLRDSKQKQTYLGRGVNCRDCRNWRLCIIFACCVSFFSRKRCLSLQSIWGYLKTSPDQPYLPPLCFYGLVWVRVPNLFGNNLSRNDFPFSKGFMKFGWPEAPPKNNCLL